MHSGLTEKAIWIVFLLVEATDQCSLWEESVMYLSTVCPINNLEVYREVINAHPYL